MKDPMITVALSRSQINELLAHTNMGPHSTEGLQQAREALRRVVREPNAANDARSDKRRA